jgi:hypothetical protein
MTTRFFIILSAAMQLATVIASAETPDYDVIQPPQVWVTYRLGEPSGKVTQKQIAGDIGTLVDRIDYDYKRYVQEYRNWMVGALDVRLTVDANGIITGADVLASDVNHQLEVMVTGDLEGCKLKNAGNKTFTVKLSLRFEAEEPIIQDTYGLPYE